MYHLLAPSGENHLSLPGDALPGLLTWDEVARAAAGVADELRREGLTAGGVVAVEGRTSVEVVLTIFAAWRCGCAVTVLPPAPAAAPEAFGRELAARRARLAIRAVFLATPAGVLPPAALSGLVRLDAARVAAAALRSPSPEPPAAPAGSADPAGGAGPGDVAIFQATSGTTGQPRLVPVTWRMLLANLAGMTERLGLCRDDRVVSWMPLYHDMGLIGYLALPAYLDASLALVPPTGYAAAPALWAKLVQRERATFSGMTTGGLALLERSLHRAHTYDLSSMRRIVVGAEMVDLALCEAVVATGGRHGLHPGVFAFAYGLAEGALAVSIAPPAPPAAAEEAPGQPGGGWLRPRDRGFARLGRPLSGVDVRIVPAGADTGPVGEIEIRGPSTMAGYVGEEGGGPGPGGWLPTGDLGYLTAGGEVVVVGRSKDILVVGGRKLAPDDVERVVGALAGVRRSRVVAVPGVGPAGEGFSIVAERARGGCPDEQAVRVALRRQFGVTPLRVAFVAAGAIPRTTSGKLRRRAAAALLGERAERRAVPIDQTGRR